jgi:hypothetical protein
MIDWPLWCVYCGTSPIVPERYTTELRQLFPNDVPTLKTMGILHDLHLRILASLSDSRRHAFLLSFVPKKYTQFRALQISALLNKYGKEHADESLPAGEMEVVCTVGLPSRCAYLTTLMLSARSMPTNTK